MKVGRALGATFIGLTAMALVTAVMPTADRVIGTPAGIKLNHLLRLSDDVNVLFVGPSYVARHVDTPLFDRITGEQGIETFSFNLGLGGASAFEIHWLLRHLQVLELPQLRWVFVDLSAVADPADYLRTQRWKVWHDLPETLLALDAIWNSEPPKVEHLADRFSLSWAHWMRLVENGFHIGENSVTRLRQIRRAHRTAERRRGQSRTEAAGLQGFQPLFVENGDIFLKRHQRFEENVDQFTANVARVSGLPPQDRHVPLGPVERKIAEGILGSIRRLGAEPVVMLPPIVRPIRVLPASVEIPLTLSFSGITAYADLYDPLNRFDAAHLNPKGARRYTAYLAAGFVRHQRELASR